MFNDALRWETVAFYWMPNMRDHTKIFPGAIIQLSVVASRYEFEKNTEAHLDQQSQSSGPHLSTNPRTPAFHSWCQKQLCMTQFNNFLVKGSEGTQVHKYISFTRAYLPSNDGLACLTLFGSGDAARSTS